MNDETQLEDDVIDDANEDSQLLASEDAIDVESVTQGDASAEEEPKTRSRNQNAKSRLRRKLNDSEDRNQQLLGIIAKQNERHTALESKIDSVINPPPPRPDRVDFETEEDYEDALHHWRQPVEIEVKTSEPAVETIAQKSFAPEATRDNWFNQIDLAREKYDDFEEKLKSIPQTNMTDIMTLSIMESDHGGEIAYFLGDNLSESERISKLSIAAQVREIDKLGNKFQSNTSSAPTPIVPTTGADSPTTDPSKMSMKEYAAYMNRKERGG